MQYCSRCVMPNTKPGIRFDAIGVCSACRSIEKKKLIDWDARAQQLNNFCDEIRGENGNGYDCIVPVSGGKDSMYQAYMMSKVYNLRVLCVVVMAHLQTKEGIRNLNALVSNIGVDLIKVNVRPSVLKKIRRTAFVKIGNPNYADHRVVFSAVARTALFYNVPLVVWGEDIGVEFGGNVDDDSQSSGSADNLINNDLFREVGFSELVGDKIKDSELFFYLHPHKEEMENKKIRSMYLGYFHWWDGYKHYQVARKYGFRPRESGPLSGNVLDYDNIDEKLCEIHIWFKFLKCGFWRPTDQCCYKIWNGYMEREEAVVLVNEKQYEFPKEYYKEFLEYHELTDNEFWSVVETWRNHDLWHKKSGVWKLKYELQ